MIDELKMDWSDFEQALARRAATSKRDHLSLAVEQMKGLMREVVKITPPGHEGVEGGTCTAMQHGQATAAADINSLYGGPGDAYDLIAETSQVKASAFWFMHSAGNDAQAATILKSSTGRWFGPFDDGKIHSTHYRRGRVKQNRGKPIIYVSDPKSLADYIKQKQGHVMYLTSGWKAAFTKLGMSMPQFITKHDAPGQMAIEISDDRIRLIATNSVSYTAAVDLQRRIQYAIDRQRDKMDRQWQTYNDQLNKKAGL